MILAKWEPKLTTSTTTMNYKNYNNNHMYPKLPKLIKLSNYNNYHNNHTWQNYHKDLFFTNITNQGKTRVVNELLNCVTKLKELTDTKLGQILEILGMKPITKFMMASRASG